MATVRLLLGIFCLIVCGGFVKPSRYFLVEVNRLKIDRKLPTPTSPVQTATSQLQTKLQTKHTQLPTKILAIARTQLGVREATGKNDGTAVEAYLSYTGNKKGEPWCASFVSWVFGSAGFAQPRTAWSPALFPKVRLISTPIPASVFGIYYPKLGRIAHCGLVEAAKGNWVHTIEGNTNTDGSAEGNGVYRKLRHQRTIAKYADWITKAEKGVVP